MIGPQVLAAYPDRILNTHPSLLPAFPGAHAVRDALAAGVKVTGATVHLVDETLDGGPIVAQEAVPILPGDDESTLHDRIRAVEHRLLPRSVALLLGGALSVGPDGRRVMLDLGRADHAVPVPRRALLSVSDKTGLVELGRGLVDARFRARLDRRHGPRAARRRPARHRRRRGDRLPGDARRADQDASSARSRRHPGRPTSRGSPPAAPRSRDRPVRARGRQSLPVRRGRRTTRYLVRRARRGDRHRRPVDGPGGGEEPRVGRDRHLARPLRRDSLGHRGAGEHPGRAPRRPRRRGVSPHGRLRRPDRRRAARSDGGGGTRAPGRTGPSRRRRSLPAERHDRPREGRDAALRRKPAPGGRPLSPARDRRRRWAVRDGRRAAPGQAALVQQRPRRIGRGGHRPDPRGRRLRHRQAHQPVRRGGARHARRRVGGGARWRSRVGVRWRRRA